MRKNNRTGKRLRLFPLILGSYAIFLGLGLIIMGLAEIREGIGMIRLLIGLGMAGFGLVGIWDGVRDLIKPEKKTETRPEQQFILTDTSGIRSSNVTPEFLRKQMDILVESEDPRRFAIQILPPLSVGEHGQLKQISCIYHGNIILVAFFEMPKAGYRIFQKSTEPDMAVEWLKQLLAGSPDFSEWKDVEINVRCDEEVIQQKEEDENTHGDEDAGMEEDGAQEETDAGQNAKTFFLDQLWDKRNGQPIIYWHKLLVVFGESWHNELKFFSVRDMELAVEGIYEGKYQKVILRWGMQAVVLLHGIQNDMMVIWCTNHPGKGNPCFLAKEGTMTQVKFWLAGYINSGFFERSGWADVTDRIEKEKRKGNKKHGKLF